MWRKQGCASQIWTWLWSLLLQQYCNCAKGSHLFPSSVAKTQRNRERQRAKVLFYSKPFLSLRAHCAIIFPFSPHFRPFLVFHVWPSAGWETCWQVVALTRLGEGFVLCVRGTDSLPFLNVTASDNTDTGSQHHAKDPLQRSAASFRKQRWAFNREKYTSGTLLLSPQTPLTPGSHTSLFKRDL